MPATRSCRSLCLSRLAREPRPAKSHTRPTATAAGEQGTKNPLNKDSPTGLEMERWSVRPGSRSSIRTPCLPPTRALDSRRRPAIRRSSTRATAPVGLAFRTRNSSGPRNPWRFPHRREASCQAGNCLSLPSPSSVRSIAFYPASWTEAPGPETDLGDKPAGRVVPPSAVRRRGFPWGEILGPRPGLGRVLGLPKRQGPGRASDPRSPPGVHERFTPGPLGFFSRLLGTPWTGS